MQREVTPGRQWGQGGGGMWTSVELAQLCPLPQAQMNF